MRTLAQWREALAEREASPYEGQQHYYQHEMVDLLEAGEQEAEAERARATVLQRDIYALEGHLRAWEEWAEAQLRDAAIRGENAVRSSLGLPVLMQGPTLRSPLRKIPESPYGPRARAQARDVEPLAREAHDAWLAEKRRRGVTSWPNEHGVEQMVPWSELGEDVREFDRVVVRAVLRELRLV